MPDTGVLDMFDIDPRGVQYTETAGFSSDVYNKPNAFGAVGPYQLTPIAFKDLQRVYPNKYSKEAFNKVAVSPELSKTAMLDYMGVLRGYAEKWGIDPSTENLLQMYNVGPGDFKKGKRNQGYVDKYYEGVR